MGTIFFIPLSVIALYESSVEHSRYAWVDWLRSNDEGEADSPKNRDPQMEEDDDSGLVISRVPFTELVKVFPNTEQVCPF